MCLFKVIRDTGVFQGLFTVEELTYTNIKNREDKMQFLQKIIDVVGKLKRKKERISNFYQYERSLYVFLRIDYKKIIGIEDIENCRRTSSRQDQ